MCGCSSRCCFSYRRSIKILKFERSINILEPSVTLRALLERRGSASLEVRQHKGCLGLSERRGEPVLVLIDLSPFQPLCSWVNLPRIGLANRNIGIPQCWVSKYNRFISLLCRVILSSFFLTERIKVPKRECGELDTSPQAQ